MSYGARLNYALILASLCLAACSEEGQAPAGMQQAAGGRLLERFGPDEFGVVCYRKQGFEGISCVKVQPPVQGNQP